MHGIYFEDQDAYNYMQHLKPIGEDPNGVFIPSTEITKSSASSTTKKSVTFHLPDEVFPSKTESKIGLLNQQASDYSSFDPNLDPSLREVLIALEDEEYVENDLEEDFFEALDAQAIPKQYVNMVQEAENREKDWELDHFGFQKTQVNRADQDSEDSDSINSDEEHIPRYAKTNFSMTSSAMFRNQNLTLLDDRFDKVLNDYSDEESEDSADALSLSETNEILNEFLLETETIGRKRKVIPKRNTFEETIQSLNKPELEAVLARLALEEDNSLHVPEVERIDIDEQRRDWDVESMLSTYSNLYHRPTLIKELSHGVTPIKLKGRKKLPVVVEEEISETKEKTEEQELLENKGKARSRSETILDKKLRKAAIKEERKIRRIEKKSNQKVFKQELNRQEKVLEQKQKNAQTISLL
jgi:protein LTV1